MKTTTWLTSEEQRLLDGFGVGKAAYETSFQKAVGVVRGDSATAYQEADAIVKEQDRPATDALNALSQSLADRSQARGGALAAGADSITAMVTIALLIAAVMGIGIAMFISRAILRGVSTVVRAAERLATTDLPNMVRVAEAIADGDLTQTVHHVEGQRVEVKSSDDGRSSPGPSTRLPKAPKSRPKPRRPP